MATRLGLRDLLAAAPRAIGRYTGTLLAVFVIETVVTLACMLAVSVVLANAFAKLPMFDEAVDGDLVALMYMLRHGKAAITASAGIVFGAVLLWQLMSWFIAGGIYGVLVNRPEGRGDTARAFGAAGATTFLTYVRLSLCSLPGLLLVLFVQNWCTNLAQPRIEYALNYSQLASGLALALGPALLLLHVLWTVTDYARVELTLRGESHAPGVVVTYMRTVAYVLKRPLTLVHAGLGWIVFIVITIGSAYLSQGHPMYGAEGAITLFVIRQGVALARTAIRFGVMAGQIELGKTRALPPRRPDAKVEPKKS